MSALAAGCSAALLGLANACGGTDTTTGTTSGAQTDGGSTGGAASGSGATTSSGGAINGSGSTSSGAGGRTGSGTGGRASSTGGTAQGGRGNTGTSGGPGNGGSSACPPECFVNNMCVEICGQPPTDFGCCPCPAGMINVYSCGAGGASGSGGASSGGTTCDPRRALCRSLPPTCPTGQVPSIDGMCWGPCVPIATCTCTAAADCPDPNQYTCHMSRGVCDYYVN